MCSIKVAARPDAVNGTGGLPDQREVPFKAAVDEVARQFRLFIHVGAFSFKKPSGSPSRPMAAFTTRNGSQRGPTSWSGDGMPQRWIVG